MSRDRPAVVIVKGRQDLSRSDAPLIYAYRGPHGEWFKSIAERYVGETKWTRLPPTRVETATRRELLTGGFIKPRDTAIVDMDRCVWCKLCLKCPTSAVMYREREYVEIRYDRCVDCGLCNSLCPVGAIQMPSLPDGFLAELVKTSPGPLRFICDYGMFDTDIEGVRVRCIAAVPKQYLYIAASRHGEARAYCSRGESCPLWKAVEIWAAGLVREGKEFVVRAKRAPLDPGDRWQSRLLAVTVGMSTGVLKVKEGCTLCGACVYSCPTKALSLKGLQLAVTPALCVTCGGCVEKCPEGVIEVRESPVESPYQAEVLYRDKPARCISCGKELPYSETMARVLAKRLEKGGVSSGHIYLCDSCKVKHVSLL
ncbi:MAG: 4Fe-4S dicluster domain-containing protein [Pyrobaculum sp.]